MQDWLAQRLVARFLAQAGPAHEVLEIGTGAGRVASAFLERGVSVVGVEPTSALRKETARRCAATDTDAAFVTVEASLPKLDGVKREHFGHVVTFHVVEHAPDPYSAREWFEGIAATLRPGGFALIAAPHAADYGWRFWDCDWSHGWATTPMRIAEMGADTGLRPVRVEVVRGTFSNPGARAALRLGSWLTPTGVVDRACSRVLGTELLGTGLQVALGWRLCWVLFQKPT